MSTEPTPPSPEYTATVAAYDAVKVAVAKVLTARIPIVPGVAYTTLTHTGRRDGLPVLEALESIGLMLIAYTAENADGETRQLKADTLDPDAPWAHMVDPASVDLILALATLGPEQVGQMNFPEETDPMPVLLVMAALAARAGGGENWVEVFDGFADGATTELRLGPYEHGIRDRAKKVGVQRLEDNLAALCDAGVAVDTDRVAALYQVLRDETAQDADFKQAWGHYTGYLLGVLTSAATHHEPGTFDPSPDQIDKFAAAPFEADGAWHTQPDLAPAVRDSLRSANGMPHLSVTGALGLEPLIAILFADHVDRRGADWREEAQWLMFQYRHQFGL